MVVTLDYNTIVATGSIIVMSLGYAIVILYLIIKNIKNDEKEVKI